MRILLDGAQANTQAKLNRNSASNADQHANSVAAAVASNASSHSSVFLQQAQRAKGRFFLPLIKTCILLTDPLASIALVIVPPEEAFL